jgi:hypothetical protein
MFIIFNSITPYFKKNKNKNKVKILIRIIYFIIYHKIHQKYRLFSIELLII